MKNIIKKYYGLLIGLCGISLVVSAYLGIVLNKPLIMLIGACLAFVIVGFFIYLRDFVIKNEMKAFFSDLEVNKEILLSSSENNKKTILDTVVNSEKRIMDFSTKQFNVIEKNILAALQSGQDNINNNFNQKTSDVISKLSEATKSVKNDFTEGNGEVLNVIDNMSTANAEVYNRLSSQIAMLQRQNSHLMMLTTMIGTIRSDIAAINEVKAFKEEHKLGRKIRHVRDDEHGIVIENLMNGDGIRIEKSVMFKNDSLVFEAEFDKSGRMTKSRNYGENTNVYTEITYSNGNVIKSVLGKLFETKK